MDVKVQKRFTYCQFFIPPRSAKSKGFFLFVHLHTYAVGLLLNNDRYSSDMLSIIGIFCSNPNRWKNKTEKTLSPAAEVVSILFEDMTYNESGYSVFTNLVDFQIIFGKIVVLVETFRMMKHCMNISRAIVIR